MNMVQWKLKVYITMCYPVSRAKKKGYGGCTPTYKLALLQLVETEKNFSKEIMREQLWKLKRRAGGLALNLPQDLQRTK